MSDAGTYSDTANINRVKAGLKGAGPFLKNGNPAPKLTFVDALPKDGVKGAWMNPVDNKMPIVDTWPKVRR